MMLPAHDSSINVPYRSNAVIDVQHDEVPRPRLSRKNAEAPRQTVMGMDTIVTRTHVQYPAEMGVDCSVDRSAKKQSNPSWCRWSPAVFVPTGCVDASLETGVVPLTVSRWQLVVLTGNW